MRRFPERLHHGNWGYSSPEEVSGLSEYMLSWVFVTKSSPLCKGEGGNRVARICMSKESRKFEQFPVIVYMTLLKLPLAYLFFKFFFSGSFLVLLHCCCTGNVTGCWVLMACPRECSVQCISFHRTHTPESHQECKSCTRTHTSEICISLHSANLNVFVS